jgi:hypothetical protein
MPRENPDRVKDAPKRSETVPRCTYESGGTFYPGPPTEEKKP